MLEDWMGQQRLQAGCLISGIGSLSVARLRLAGRQEITTLPGDLEILSLAGTLSVDGAHLHIALADNAGAELVVGLLPDWQFSRKRDPATGCAELQIRPVPGNGDRGETR